MIQDTGWTARVPELCPGCCATDSYWDSLKAPDEIEEGSPQRWKCRGCGAEAVTHWWWQDPAAEAALWWHTRTGGDS